MEAKQLRARRGQVYKHRLDPQTVFMMRGITEDLEKDILYQPKSGRPNQKGAPALCGVCPGLDRKRLGQNV